MSIADDMSRGFCCFPTQEFAAIVYFEPPDLNICNVDRLTSCMDSFQYTVRIGEVKFVIIQVKHRCTVCPI